MINSSKKKKDKKKAKKEETKEADPVGINIAKSYMKEIYEKLDEIIKEEGLS